MSETLKTTNASENARTDPLWEANYHNQIADEFIRLRGYGFALSPFDLRLVDRWQELGVPVTIPLNVIEEINERRPANHRRPRSLAYIQEEVEARFAELLEGHIGCGGCDRSYCGGKRTAA